MGFGHRVYRAEDPRARVLRAHAPSGSRRPALRGGRRARAGRAGRAARAPSGPRHRDQRRVLGRRHPGLRRGAGQHDARDVHLWPHRRLVRAHPGAEAAGQAGPPVGRSTSARARAARSPSRAGTRSPRLRDRTRATFASAARSIRGAGAPNPRDRWDGPGLGEWDLRSLVGHTSRSLITVSSYLQTAAEREDVGDAAGVLRTDRGLHVERRAPRRSSSAAGRRAATSARIRRRRSTDSSPGDGRARRTAGDPLIGVIGGLGMRLHTYLPTRTFELAVHGLDIARATGFRSILTAGSARTRPRCWPRGSRC